MKKQLFATMLAATLFTLPLAACGGASNAVKQNGEKFVIADYALDLDGVTAEYKGYAHDDPDLTKQFYRMTPISGASFSGEPELMMCNYGLYNVKSNTYPDGNNTYEEISYVSGTPFLKMRASLESEEYYFAAPTGQRIRDWPYYSYQTSSGALSNGSTYYKLTLSEEEAFYWTYDKTAQEWKELTAEEATGTKDTGEYQVGDTVGVKKYPVSNLVFGSGEVPEEYIYADISYAIEKGNGATRYTFYRAGEKVGSFSMYGEYTLGIIGKYFYFYEIEAVSTDSLGGYNFESFFSSNGSQVFKGNIALYRFDITSGALGLVNPSYFYLPISSEASLLYNKTKHDADKAVVNAVKKVNGIFVLNELSTTYRLIIDENAKVSVDLTDKPIDENAKFYQLGENAYLSGNLVLDGDMNTVVQLPGDGLVWRSQGLIISRPTTSTAIVTDYEGKVVIPEFTITKSYSDQLSVSGKNIVGYLDGVQAVFSAEYPDGRTLSEVTGDWNSTLTAAYGMIMATDDTTTTFYDLSGAYYGSFNGVSPSVYTIAGKTVFSFSEYSVILS